MTTARWTNARILLTTFVVATIAVAVYLYLAVNNWHWEWTWCGEDSCSTGIELVPVFTWAAITGGIVATEVLALATPGRARSIGLAMIPVLAFAVVFFLVPEVREFLFP